MRSMIAEPQHASEEPHPFPSPDDVVPTTLQFLVSFIALILAIFCVPLDNAIIVTAIPRVTDAYKTLHHVVRRQAPCINFKYIPWTAATYFRLYSTTPSMANISDI